MAIPWHRIPAFISGNTDVEQYSRTVQFVYRLWPVNQRDGFITSLLLKVEGTAAGTIMSNEKFFMQKDEQSVKQTSRSLVGAGDV